MAFVTEVVLFRARPAIAVQHVVEAAEGGRPTLAGLDGTIDRSFGSGADGLPGNAIIDGPGVRPYHFRSRSL
jgi:hypothetical protein